MLRSVRYRLVEFFIIFILLPISFALPYPFEIKATISILGFGYVVFILLKVERKLFRIAPRLKWAQFFKHVFIKLLVIAFLTLGYMWLTSKGDLFHVFLEKPKLWLIILFVYALFSVYPQEVIYRTLYFERYGTIIKNESLLIFINAVVFSLAHIFYRNSLVLLMTFLGGILFALTYHKTKSTILVTIEHAIYGCWLFTVGMGDMLGFPS